MSKPKGFAAMSKEERQRISSLGGKAAQASGVAHRWTSEEARRAGRIGGLAMSGKRHKTVDIDETIALIDSLEDQRQKSTSEGS